MAQTKQDLMKIKGKFKTVEKKSKFKKATAANSDFEEEDMEDVSEEEVKEGDEEVNENDDSSESSSGLDSDDDNEAENDQKHVSKKKAEEGDEEDDSNESSSGLDSDDDNEAENDQKHVSKKKAEEGDEEDDSNESSSGLDSDDDDNEAENDDIEKEETDEKHVSKKKAEEQEKLSRDESIRNKIVEKYNEIKGQQLFIRFSKKLPEDLEEFNKLVSAQSSLIKWTHKPRQKSARFCLVDFKSESDRNTALHEINNKIRTTEVIDENEIRAVVAEIPRTETDDFVRKIVDRKLQSVDNKRNKLALKKATAGSVKNKNFTSTLLVSNLPKNASLLELRTYFPTAIDMQIKNNVATVTLPTTREARDFIKKQIILAGQVLKLSFAKKRKNKKFKNKKNKAAQRIETLATSKEAETSPATAPAKKKKKKTTEDVTTAEPAKKKKSTEDVTTPEPAKKKKSTEDVTTPEPAKKKKSKEDVTTPEPAKKKKKQKM